MEWHKETIRSNKQDFEMKKSDAKQIAETITNEQILEMFNKAKVGIKDWTQTSACNKSVSKGVAWNVLASNFDVKYQYSDLAKTNMVHEFGDFLQDNLKPKSAVMRDPPSVYHQDPVF